VKEFIGWLSSAILLCTLLRQVYTQWKTGSSAGLSKWLFAGQVTASIGFTAYSVLLRNWVYATSNVAILLTAVLGQVLYLKNKHRKKRKSAS
jgi:MtN3 and saliva related transmembrane protein